MPRFCPLKAAPATATNTTLSIAWTPTCPLVPRVAGDDGAAGDVGDGRAGEGKRREGSVAAVFAAGADADRVVVVLAEAARGGDVDVDDQLLGVDVEAIIAESRESLAAAAAGVLSVMLLPASALALVDASMMWPGTAGIDNCIVRVAAGEPADAGPAAIGIDDLLAGGESRVAGQADGVGGRVDVVGPIERAADAAGGFAIVDGCRQSLQRLACARSECGERHGRSRQGIRRRAGQANLIRVRRINDRVVDLTTRQAADACAAAIQIENAKSNEFAISILTASTAPIASFTIGLIIVSTS